jgi:hypothetical protein
MRRRTGEPLALIRAALARSTPALALAAALGAAPAPVLAAAAGDEAVEVEATLDRSEVAPGEGLVVRVRVAADAPSSIEPPRSEDFEIVSRGSSRQSFFSLQGGKATARHETTYAFTLEPRREGTLTVPPFVVTIDGKRHETGPLTVKVTPGAARAPDARPDADREPPPRGRSSWRGWERDLVLDVQVDRREAWLGEQITATVWLVSPAGVVGYHSYRPPLYDGFWAEPVEMPQSLVHQIRMVNGVPMRAYLVQRIALFPTRAGTVTLGSFQAEVEVRLGGGAFDPFATHRRARRVSRPVAIQVRPLPPGAPPGFEGVNVGKIDLTAEVSAASVAAGDPVTVRVRARGEGNVRVWSLPRPPPLPGTRAYDATSSEQVEPRGGRIRGSRTLEAVIVPERAGELVVPPLAWSWFDPLAGEYRRGRTAELRVSVSPAAPAGPSPGANALAAGLRPIRSEGRLSRAGGPPWESPLFAAAVALPVLAFAGMAAAGLVSERRRAGSGARRLRDAGRAARRRLARAGKLARRGDAAAFLAELERALVAYAADKLGRPAAGMRREELSRALAAAGAHPHALRALAAALDACDAARFGRSAADREAMLAAAERALRLLEEADWDGAEGRA